VPAGALVVLGRDTRPSSPGAAALVARGVRAAGALVADEGVATTPQLHHCVRMRNALPARAAAYGGLGGYVAMLREAFAGVLAGADAARDARGPLVVDCANGVGALAAAALAPAFADAVTLSLRNTGATAAEAAALNEGCGAEHAQKARLPPAGFAAPADAGARCASLDGDADRLVYHTFRAADGAWRLLDGDKIACLVAAFLADALAAAGLAVVGAPAAGGEHGAHAAPRGWDAASAWRGSPLEALEALRAAPVSVGIVQTAYANGASTDYIRGTLKLPVVVAKTGVKFVHAAASAFDVGVYFEANGHGTVLFAPAFAARLEAAVLGLGPAALAEALGGHAAGAAAAAALARLFWSSRLINQAVGDALSDALFAEAVLALKGWSVADWDALYEDLPSRQDKVAVPDRAAFVPTPDETRCLAPAAAQAAIDALVAATPRGRAFARPSGTEDVVRVYAEAATQAAADKLCADVIAAVRAAAGAR